MERKNPYLKIAAVVSAVLLVGAFVSYRAGAFDRFAKPAPQPATPPALFEDDPASDTDPQSQMFMYSSKSAPAFTPYPPANPPAPGSPPTYMGGSKFITIVPAPADPPKPAP